MPDDNAASIPSEEALLAGAAIEARRLTEISAELLRQVKLSKIERVYFIGVTATILAVCFTLVWIALGNRSLNQSVKDNTALIIDCTTSGGKCHDASLKQQAQAVAQISQANLAAAWCSAHEPTFDTAQKCVIRLTRPH